MCILEGCQTRIRTRLLRLFALLCCRWFDSPRLNYVIPTTLLPQPIIERLFCEDVIRPGDFNSLPLIIEKGLLTESVLDGTQWRERVKDIVKGRMKVRNIAKMPLSDLVGDIRVKSLEWRMNAANKVREAALDGCPLHFGPFEASVVGDAVAGDSLEVTVLGQTMTLPKALLDIRRPAMSRRVTSHVVDSRAFKLSLDLDGDVVRASSVDKAPKKSLLKVDDVVERLRCRLGDTTIDVTDPTDIMTAIEWNKWTSVSVTFKGLRVRLFFVILFRRCRPCCLFRAI